MLSGFIGRGNKTPVCFSPAGAATAFLLNFPSLKSLKAAALRTESLLSTVNWLKLWVVSLTLVHPVPPVDPNRDWERRPITDEHNLNHYATQLGKYTVHIKAQLWSFGKVWRIQLAFQWTNQLILHNLLSSLAPEVPSLKWGNGEYFEVLVFVCFPFQLLCFPQYTAQQISKKL